MVSDYSVAKAGRLVSIRMTLKLMKTGYVFSVIACAVIWAAPLYGGAAVRTVPLAKVPAAAQRTIKAEVGDGKIERIEPTDEGEPAYEVEFKRVATSRSFAVSTDGKLLRYEMFLSELPQAVQTVMKSQSANGRLGKIERVIDDDETSYQTEVIQRRQHRSLTVSGDGSSFSIEIDLKDAPAAVQKSIREHVGNGKIEEVDRTNDDGEITYEVDFTKDGSERSLTVAPSGKLLEIVVALEETPAPVQKAIKALIGAGKVGEITKVFDDDGVKFEFETTKQGIARDYTLDDHGRTISAQLVLVEAPEPIQKAIRQKLGDAKLTRIDKLASADGKITYAIQGRQGQEELDFILKADGTVAED